ncbi:chorismate synthase [Candidatus Peregrinibacteria bacterium]|nr:chorismate synthase [Candidatus Peregrinibacteria bacterium]
MAGNTFGQIFRITTFGESHGPALGVVIDGCPAGIFLKVEDIQKELDRRKPKSNVISTSRKEPDVPEILSGVFENRTLGSPIAILIRNANQMSKDYAPLKNVYRPGHADFTYEAKYGIRDYRGGGRSSGRETAARVAAAAVAKKILEPFKIHIIGYAKQIGNIKMLMPQEKILLKNIEKNVVRCPDLEIAKLMEELIAKKKQEGDSLGGIVEIIIKNTPIGLGEPVFDKLEADIGKAVLSIGAVKGIEFGSGFEGATKTGSENNDEFTMKHGKITTRSNHSGGIQGGISNGKDIVMRIAVKPTSSILKTQKTVSKDGGETPLKIEGRHDACIVPRLIPVAESMVAIVLADHILRMKNAKEPLKNVTS